MTSDQPDSPFPSRFCTTGHVGVMHAIGDLLHPACSCGWTGHLINTLRSAKLEAHAFRGTALDALRELASHVGYDRASHEAAADSPA